MNARTTSEDISTLLFSPNSTSDLVFKYPKPTRAGLEHHSERKSQDLLFYIIQL